MRSGPFRSSRAIAVAIVFASAACGVSVSDAGAATRSGDAAIARAGLLEPADLPAGFEASREPQKTHSDNIKLAKGVAGCGPYISVQKSVSQLPQAKSPRFDDGARVVGNEVDVFASERAASAALALYAKSSIVGCLENLFEKQARQDPALRDVVDDIAVSLERQDIAGIGDDSVVYEGSVVLTGDDGSSTRVGIGSAAVQVGRTVDVVTYSTEGPDLTEVLTPAIDASVARLRAALLRSPT
jgi:hypothetical protein